MDRITVLGRPRLRARGHRGRRQRDLAYVVGYERSLASLDGGPVQPNVVRATHVYRREDGEWKIVHRHGDFPPPDKSRAD